MTTLIPIQLSLLTWNRTTPRPKIRHAPVAEGHGVVDADDREAADEANAARLIIPIAMNRPHYRRSHLTMTSKTTSKWKRFVAAGRHVVIVLDVSLVAIAMIPVIETVTATIHGIATETTSEAHVPGRRPLGWMLCRLWWTTTSSHARGKVGAEAVVAEEDAADPAEVAVVIHVVNHAVTGSANTRDALTRLPS